MKMALAQISTLLHISCWLSSSICIDTFNVTWLRQTVCNTNTTHIITKPLLIQRTSWCLPITPPPFVCLWGTPTKCGLHMWMTSVAFIVVLLSAVVVALMAVAVFMETGDTISEESRFAIPVFGESSHLDRVLDSWGIAVLNSYFLGIVPPLVWDSSEIMTAAWAVLIWQALINLVGVVAMINLQSGPVLSKWFNPCCCGSCSWAPGKGLSVECPGTYFKGVHLTTKITNRD